MDFFFDKKGSNIIVRKKKEELGMELTGETKNFYIQSLWIHISSENSQGESDTPVHTHFLFSSTWGCKKQWEQLSCSLLLFDVIRDITEL